MESKESTPWKPPKPDVDIFRSTDTIRRQKFETRSSGTQNQFSPETPLKSSKSKFVLTPHITPFPLSPNPSKNLFNSPTPLFELSNGHNKFTKKTKKDETSSSPIRFREKVESSLEELYMIENTKDLCDSDYNDDIDYECLEVLSSDIVPILCPWKCPFHNILDDHYFRNYYPDIICSHHDHNSVANDFLNTQFEIIETLGRGSFSSVFKVRQRSDGKLYALKKSKEQFTGTGDRLSKIEEVKNLLLANGSPNCIKLNLSWEQSGYLYILTEYCSNGW